MEREGLVSELIGALGHHRSGVHLELELDDGSPLAVFRPEDGDHRVVSIEHGMDVSAAFAGPDGGIDLLARVGVDTTEARRLMRCTSQDLATSTRHDEHVRHLAAVDQQELWESAERVAATSVELRNAAEATWAVSPRTSKRSRPSRTTTLGWWNAQDDHERIRRLSFFVASVATLGAVPPLHHRGHEPGHALRALRLRGHGHLHGLLGPGAHRPRTAEEAALEEAGAESYLGFHLERVNNPAGQRPGPPGAHGDRRDPSPGRGVLEPPDGWRGRGRMGPRAPTRDRRRLPAPPGSGGDHARRRRPTPAPPS